MKENNKVVNAMKYDILNRQQDFADSNETIRIPPEMIAGYVIRRSPTDKFKFNVYSVSDDGELLFCVANDLDFDDASAMVDCVNSQHFPVTPTPTEVVFTEVGGISKVYNITTK